MKNPGRDEFVRKLDNRLGVDEDLRMLKGDLGLRLIFRPKSERVEAHLFVAFFAYRLSITLRQHLRELLLLRTEHDQG